ncbi:MAG: hypothetical protein LBJ95_02365 [Oscillospiraceae bacterium]|nr:hypothetical protein [Oscillospiraceae bacterium]
MAKCTTNSAKSSKIRMMGEFLRNVGSKIELKCLAKCATNLTKSPNNRMIGEFVRSAALKTCWQQN